MKTLFLSILLLPTLFFAQIPSGVASAKKPPAHFYLETGAGPLLPAAHGSMGIEWPHIGLGIAAVQAMSSDRDNIVNGIGLEGRLLRGPIVLSLAAGRAFREAKESYDHPDDPKFPVYFRFGLSRRIWRVAQFGGAFIWAGPFRNRGHALGCACTWLYSDNALSGGLFFGVYLPGRKPVKKRAAPPD